RVSLAPLPLVLSVSLAPSSVVSCSADTSSAATYTLSLHDALPIWRTKLRPVLPVRAEFVVLLSFLRVAKDLVGLVDFLEFLLGGDRKRTRLNSSHVSISYAVFCLKKKNISRFGLSDVSPPVGLPRT